MNDFGLGAIPSPPDERDFPISQAYTLLGIEPPVAIPATYIVPANLPPVLDQGATPQCVAFSSAGLKLYEDRIDQATFFPFDEGTFFARIGGSSNGAVVRNAFDQMLKVGYPVRSIDDAADHRVAAYFSVPVNQADIQAALMAFGPLVLGMTWYNSWFNPVAGVLPAPSGGIAGGHAVLAIGWDSRGLRIRNSWGLNWGLQGDFFLPWAYLSSTWEAWKAIDVIEASYSRSAVNYTAIEPVRVLDTRTNVGLSGPFRVGVARALKVAGVSTIPATVVAIAGNLTVTQQSNPGYLSIGPLPHNQPTTSTLNFPKGDDRANSVTGTGLALDGSLSLTFISGTASATTHVILDVTGYFTP